MARKQDPHRLFKRGLWKLTRGFTLFQRLDFYLARDIEVKAERDLRNGEHKFLAKQLSRLLKQAGLTKYVSSDKENEVSIEPNIRLSNKEEAEAFRRQVAKHLGREAAEVAVVEEISYSINPDIDEALKEYGLKLPLALKLKKTRLITRRATARARRGE